jgi:hypothetical protein
MYGPQCLNSENNAAFVRKLFSLVRFAYVYRHPYSTYITYSSVTENFVFMTSHPVSVSASVSLGGRRQYRVSDAAAVSS